MEDSEAIDNVRSAKATFDGLTRGELAGLRVGLTWGAQDAEEKAGVLHRFAAGELDVLVSTTVIEVGVNVPNATVMDLGVSYDMVVVPIDGEGRDKLVSEYPYYAKSVIPANTYNNTEDVEGVFVYNIMLVREDLSDAMVYDMLEGIFANISTIKASHNAADKNIDITFGVDDIQLPLHPGAEAFWKDNGYIK